MSLIPLRLTTALCCASAIILSGMPAQAAAKAAVPCAKLIPFGIAKRPRPAGQTVMRILPAKVGRFVREPIAKDVIVPTNEDFNISYRSGKDSIFVGLSQNDAFALKESVETAHQDVVSDPSISRKGELYCTSSAPYFYKIPDFMAWTNGRFFFYAHGSTPRILNEFMAAFPY